MGWTILGSSVLFVDVERPGDGAAIRNLRFGHRSVAASVAPAEARAIKHSSWSIVKCALERIVSVGLESL